MGEIINADAIHINAQTKIDAARITQKSGNEKQGALSELARFSQSLSNRRKMTAAGSQITAIAENIGRNLDAATTGKLQARVRAAEELGSLASNAAAAGVGGSSIDTYNRTVELSNAMQEEQQDRAVTSDTIAAGRAIGDTMTNAVSTLGNDYYAANLDYSQYVDHKKQGLFSRLSTLAIAGAATYFGGPEAGKAVLSLSSANEHARNGDLDGANKLIGQSLTQASAGAKTYQNEAPGGKAWGVGAWNSVKSFGSNLKI